MWTKTFWANAAERAVKTAAQTLATALSLDGVDVLNLDWTQTAATVATMTLLSILTSIASTGRGNPDSPSLVEGDER